MNVARHPTCIVLAAMVLAGAWPADKPADAADLKLRDIVIALRDANPSRPVDFSHKDLSFLDLSELDFKRANLTGTNLLGANLTGANLAFVTLAGAKLDRTSLARANVAGADFEDANLYGTVFKYVKGMGSAKGLEKARNRDKATF